MRFILILSIFLNTTSSTPIVQLAKVLPTSPLIAERQYDGSSSFLGGLIGGYHHIPSGIPTNLHYYPCAQLIFPGGVAALLGGLLGPELGAAVGSFGGTIGNNKLEIDLNSLKPER